MWCQHLLFSCIYISHFDCIFLHQRGFQLLQDQIRHSSVLTDLSTYTAVYSFSPCFTWERSTRDCPLMIPLNTLLVMETFTKLHIIKHSTISGHWHWNKKKAYRGLLARYTTVSKITSFWCLLSNLRLTPSWFNSYTSKLQAVGLYRNIPH